MTTDYSGTISSRYLFKNEGREVPGLHYYQSGGKDV